MGKIFTKSFTHFFVSDTQCAKKFVKDVTSNVENYTSNFFILFDVYFSDQSLPTFLFVKFSLEWCCLNIDTQKME